LIQNSLIEKRIEKIKTQWSKEEQLLAYHVLNNQELEENIKNTKLEAVLFDESYYNALIYIFEKNK